MNDVKKVRNGYIDIVKFLFAIIVTEFHLNTGLFPGGRIAVEGFFFISGFFMMQNINRNKYPEDSLGVSTVKFMVGKFKTLFPYLLPAALFAFSIDNYIYQRTFLESIKLFPLLLFDIFPLCEAGFQGVYVVGISWYLAAMFLSLAILYPLCKKFGSNFVLTVCPIACLLLYGTLSHFYGNMAIGTNWLNISLISSGVLRGLAGCAAGCLLSEICRAISKRQVNIKGRLLFTVLEILGFIYLFFSMKFLPLSKYEFILVFVIFGLLIIGIGGLSYSSVIFRGNWTKFFGITSTLLVLSHHRINVLFKHLYGADYIHTDKLWICICCLALCCLVVWICGWVITKSIDKISKIKIWKE